MDLALLTLHNVSRWLVLIAAVYVLARMLGGLRTRRAWNGADSRAGRLFVGVMDWQLLLGLLLYVVGPTMRAVSDLGFGAALRQPGLRFFAVEHVVVMLVAVALAHAGSVLVRRAAGVQQFTRAALWYGLSLAAVLAAVPWVQRPLLRVFSLVVGA
jgi:hypothetical protein